jgi:hypothetical protein
MAPSFVKAARTARVSETVTVEVFNPDPTITRSADSKIDLGSGGTLYINGWAFPNSKLPNCSSIGLLTDNNRLVAGIYGDPRQDVATYYKAPSRANVGYAFAIPAGEFSSGSHKAYVVCFDRKGVGYRNETSFDINTP